MLEEKVEQFIQQYNLIQENEAIVVGVSGGPDSMALLQFLANRKIGNNCIYVAHVNHGIRKEAKEDSQYVEQYCKKRNIPFFVKEVNIQEIAKQQKIGTEEAGRMVRYDFFNEIANQVGASKIATAHTANDNAETVLMHLLRGTGTSRITWNGSNKRTKIYSSFYYMPT